MAGASRVAPAAAGVVAPVPAPAAPVPVPAVPGTPETEAPDPAVKTLIEKGQKQGYLTYDEINEAVDAHEVTIERARTERKNARAGETPSSATLLSAVS